jgi:hypothetical protein
MLNIKTSDPYDLKPVELTPAELDSVAGGQLLGLAAFEAAALTAAALSALYAEGQTRGLARKAQADAVKSVVKSANGGGG